MNNKRKTERQRNLNKYWLLQFVRNNNKLFDTLQEKIFEESLVSLLNPSGTFGGINRPYWKTKMTCLKLRQKIAQEGKKESFCVRLDYFSRLLWERRQSWVYTASWDLWISSIIITLHVHNENDFPTEFYCCCFSLLVWKINEENLTNNHFKANNDAFLISWSWNRKKKAFETCCLG